jgi:hypothetical protein
MTRRRNIQHSFPFININNSQKFDPKTSSTSSQIPTRNDEENSEYDDCFIKYGFVPLFGEKLSKTEIESTNLIEHINAITALIIYHTYSNNHSSAKSCE